MIDERVAEDAARGGTRAHAPRGLEEIGGKPLDALGNLRRAPGLDRLGFERELALEAVKPGAEHEREGQEHVAVGARQAELEARRRFRLGGGADGGGVV